MKLNLNLSNILKKDRFQVQTYIKIKKVNYDIKLLELQNKNTLLFKDINKESVLNFKVRNIFESKENTEEIFDFFKTNEIENFMKNNKQTINFFFLGPNKSKKLSNLSGYVDYNKKKNIINDGILQKTIKFLIKNYENYEIAIEIIKNENNNLEKFTKNLKTDKTYNKNNFFSIKTISDLKFINEYIIKIKSRFFNNFNLLIILHLKNKKYPKKIKLITFTRLSLDESLNSNNKIQQILSYSDYLALKKYILFLKDKDLSQTSLNNVFSSSKLVKELNDLIFGNFTNYNDEFEDLKNLQSFFMIQYINPNESCYESCLNSLIYVSYFSKRFTTSKIKTKKLHSLKIKNNDKEVLECENNFKLKLKSLENIKDSFNEFRLSLNYILCENFNEKFLMNNKNEVLEKIQIFSKKEKRILMDKERNFILDEFKEDENYIKNRMKKYQKENLILDGEIKELNDNEYNLEKELNELKLHFKNKIVSYDHEINKKKINKIKENDFKDNDELKIFDFNKSDQKRKSILDLKNKYFDKIKKIKNNYRKSFNSLLIDHDFKMNKLNKKFEDQKISMKTSIKRFEKDFIIYHENKLKNKKIFEEDFELFTSSIIECPKFLGRFNKDLFLIKNNKKKEEKNNLENLSLEELLNIEEELKKKINAKINN